MTPYFIITAGQFKSRTAATPYQIAVFTSGGQRQTP
jgi:hypothetical protein